MFPYDLLHSDGELLHAVPLLLVAAEVVDEVFCAKAACQRRGTKAVDRRTDCIDGAIVESECLANGKDEAGKGRVRLYTWEGQDRPRQQERS